MKTQDIHAYLVIDCNGELMGVGPTEADAIESAAKALEQEVNEIEETLEKCKGGYRGEESLFLRRVLTKKPMKPMTYIVTHDGIRGYIIRETEPNYYEIRWSGGTCVLHESCLTIDPLMEDEE